MRESLAHRALCTIEQSTNGFSISAGCAWYGERIEHFPAGSVLREHKGEMGEVVQAEWIFADNSRLFLKNGTYALQWPK